jgi:hypothetical protein
LSIVLSHSIKRGAVQLYRMIEMLDQWIKRMIKVVGEYAHQRYTNALKEKTQDMPIFANVRAAISWTAGFKIIQSDS